MQAKDTPPGKWADAVTVTENSDKVGIELRFNAMPSPELQSKLRALAFRPSRQVLMWYGPHIPESKSYAAELQSTLGTQPNGPELHLKPSAPPNKASIEKKDFSFVLISLKNGDNKNYVVFESSKPRAEVMATSFARREFGDQVQGIAIQPRTRIREARMLFEEGKVIGESLPALSKTPEIVNTTEETPMNVNVPSRIPVLNFRLTTAKTNGFPDYQKGTMYFTWNEADNYVKSLVGHHSNVYFKIEWKDGTTHQGSVDLEPDDFFDGKQNILMHHVTNYLTFLSNAIPNILYTRMDIELAKTRLEQYQLNDESIPVENPRIEVPVTEEAYNPDIAIRAFHRWAVPQSDFQNRTDELSRNLFNTWLSEHYPKLTQTQAESLWAKHLRVIEIFNKANRISHNAILKPYGSIYTKLLKIIPGLVGHLEKGVEHGKSVVDPSGALMDLHYDFIGQEKEGSYIISLAHNYTQNGDLMRDPDMEIRIFPDRNMAEALSFEQSNLGIHQNVYSERDGKQYVNPKLKKDLNSFLNQWLTNIINQGHVIDLSKDASVDESTSGEISVEVLPAGQLSQVEDLKVGNSTVLPNVLVPSGTSEPFWSRNFDLFDMKALLPKKFPHLLNIKWQELEKADPISLFELIQLHSPADYDIDVSWSDLILIWNERGQELFEKIGYPTDPLYPYVSLNFRYERIKPLEYVQKSENDNLPAQLMEISAGDTKWSYVVEFYRPLGDLDKAIELINQSIHQKDREISLLTKASKKGKNDHEDEIHDLEDSIENFQDSLEVIEAYLDSKKIPGLDQTPATSLQKKGPVSQQNADIPFKTNDAIIYFNPFIMAQYILKENGNLLYSIYGSRFSRKHLEGREFSREEIFYLKEMFMRHVFEQVRQEQFYQELYDREKDQSFKVVSHEGLSEETREKHERDFYGKTYTRSDAEEIAFAYNTIGMTPRFSGREAFKQNGPVITLLQRYDKTVTVYQHEIAAPIQAEIDELNAKLRKARKLREEANQDEISQLQQAIEQLKQKLADTSGMIDKEWMLFRDEVFEEVCKLAKTLGFDIEHLQETTAFDISKFRDAAEEPLFEEWAAEKHLQEPIRSVVEQTIRDYFTKDKDQFLSEENVEITSVLVHTVDLTIDKVFLPNVLMPIVLKEPFASRNYELYNMHSVIAANFKHLLPLLKDDLAKAGPTTLLELLLLHHPQDYNIPVLRDDLIDEWDARGHQLFMELGLPVEPLYPYVDVTFGYEAVQDLQSILSDSEFGGNAYWYAAEHYLPVADPKKALAFIDRQLETEEEALQSLKSPSTGKARWGSEHLYVVKGALIENLKRSRQVIERYLGITSQEPDLSSASARSTIPGEQINGSPDTQDLTHRDTVVQNILMPLGVREPFLSQNADSDAEEAEAERFPDLKAITHRNWSKATPQQLFELMQMDHPEEYGFKMNRSDMIEIFQKKGESIFKNLGYPIELTYPYVNLSVGYRAVYPLGALLFDGNPVDQSWWYVAESYRPVGNMQKALDILDTYIAEGEAALKALTNAKTGKPKGKSKNEANDLIYDIKDYKRNREVITDYMAQMNRGEKTVPFIPLLAGAYWLERDQDMGKSQDKVMINGALFNKNHLEVILLKLVAALTIDDQFALTDELAERFHHRPKLSKDQDHSSLGPVIQSYIENTLKDEALLNGNESAVLKFLTETLTKGSETLADQPQDLVEDFSIKKASGAKKQTALQVNNEIEAFIDARDQAQESYNALDITYINQYTGAGGRISEGASGRGILYEYYTPDSLVKKMWGLAYKFGYAGGPVLEPAVGIGNFLRYVPKNVPVTGYETNHYAARIAQITYPNATIYEKPFESFFFQGNTHLKDAFTPPGFRLAIGNPPYGPFEGKYAGLGEKKWTGVTTYEQYFILRGLDLLAPDGLLIYLVPSSFMQNKEKFNKIKARMDNVAELLDSYRFPNGTFSTTDVGTDILVLKKKIP